MPDNQSRMTRPILIAGLLGGLLGGVVSFAASRLITPAPAKQELPPPVQATEAREVADAFIAKLKVGKTDEFVQDVKAGITFMSEQEFAQFKSDFTESRKVIPQVLGRATGEFELVRETALSPSLVRLIYLEKYERGGVAWSFTLYRTQDGWRVDDVSWNRKLGFVTTGHT
jgi:hypothetical protein